jgi:hypothetical protein
MLRQRPYLGQRQGLRRAYHEGCRHWAHYYGRRSLLEMRREVSRGELIRAMRRAKTLLEIAPQYLRSELWLRRHRR